MIWHRLLCLLRIRDDFDYTPPFAPEVRHPFEKDAKLNCCGHCGGGLKHTIHRAPYDPKRSAEVLGVDNKSLGGRELSQREIAELARRHY